MCVDENAIKHSNNFIMGEGAEKTEKGAM